MQVPLDDSHASSIVTEDFSTSATSPNESSDARLASPWHTTALGWAGLAWLLGTVGLLGRLAWQRALLLTFCRRHKEPADAVLCRQVADLARRLEMRRPVRVLQTAKLSAPAAFGILRPTVALPPSFREEFDAAEQQAVLAHEVAHLAARDPAWQFVASVLCAIVWWHPFTWLARRRLTAMGEAAADEASLLVPRGPDALAGCLVAMGRRLSDRPRLGWLSVGGPGFRPRFRSDLGRRVERLLNLSKRSWHAPGRGRMVFAKTALPVALLIIAITCTAWARPQVTISEGESRMNMLTVSWHRSLAAAALLALMGTASDNALADDGTPEKIEAVVAEGQLAMLLQDGEGDREEREGDREREHAQDREQADREERREDGDREERAREGDGERREEARDREREEHREGDRDRERGEAREAEMRERREIQEHREVAERERHEAEARRDQSRHAEELLHHRRELEERAGDIRREIEGLRDGQDAEARELHGALERIGREMREINEHLERGQQRDAPRRDVAPGMERLEEIRRQIARLSEAGHHEEAEQLKREGRQLMERMQQHRPDRPAANADLQRRLQHIRAAAENLHAAGMHDAVEHLMREAEQKVAEMRGQPTDRPRPPHDRDAPGPPSGDLHCIIGELHGQMEQMRREMQEMREQMHRLMERDRN